MYGQRLVAATWTNPIPWSIQEYEISQQKERIAALYIFSLSLYHHKKMNPVSAFNYRLE